MVGARDAGFGPHCKQLVTAPPSITISYNNAFNQVLRGDCVDAMNYLIGSGVEIDFVVCDPPYNLDSFMGKKWDNDVAMHPETWMPAFRLIKPGGYILAFGGPRTFHRIACAVEDAGFEIRDCLMWIFGSGYPKNHKSGVEGYEGWGTALKPAWEPVIMARKPLKCSTITANVRQYGTGCINIDECRIELPDGDPLAAGINGRDGSVIDTGLTEGSWGFKAVNRPAGLPRWPANVIHDGSQEATHGMPIDVNGMPTSRYFYCAKAAPKDRIYRCKDCNTSIRKYEFPDHQHGHTKLDGEPDYSHITSHPTCKPIALMRYLVRMVTPPGGLVLDPFAGSGTTLQAAKEEGFFSIGIEKEAPYIQDILRRLRQA